MSAKRNRRRASKARRSQALQSARAELNLLLDGKVPEYLRGLNYSHTLHQLRLIRKAVLANSDWMVPL